jgi:hypothetical protein
MFNFKIYFMNSILQRKSFIPLLSYVFCLLGFTSFAQVRFGGNVHIANNTTFYVSSGEISFGTGTTTTTRTANTFGKIQTADAVTFSSTGTSATQHFNGYLAAAKSGTFTTPVGDGVRYAPISFIDKSSNALATVTYWSTSTSNSSSLDGALDAISPSGFWEINSTGSSRVGFTWVSGTDIGTLTGNDLTQLVIAGYNPTTTQWEQIPSLTTGDLTTGSITSEFQVNLATYTHYTFGKRSFCQPIIAQTGVTKTWNGTWDGDGSAPTLADIAIINAPFSGSLACNSLQLNADLTLAAGQLLEIVRGVTTTNNAKVIMASTASITQRDEAATAPVIELTKTTKTMFSNRYVYWGAPLSGTFANSSIDAAIAQGQTDVSNAFDLRYQYVSGDVTATGGWQSFTNLAAGKGFITRVEQKAPFVLNTQGPAIDLKFEGTAGNGAVNVTLGLIAGSPLAARSHNLLGNPYPSPIDAAEFLRRNSTRIDGVIYVWNSGGAQSNNAFAQSDYYPWTLAGTTNISGTAGGFTDGVIPSGQGFKVRAITAGDVTFDNCMRLTQQSGSMFRSDGSLVNYNQEDANRFKVLMTGENGVSSPILVAFDAQYTTAYDTMYDAYALSAGTATFYSILENTNDRLAINALPAFEVTNEVPVGVRKTGTATETFTFQLLQPEGIFANGQAVYLFDTLTGAYHNFVDGSVSITLSESVTNNRFQLRFQDPLSNPDFQNALSFVSWYQNETIEVKCSENLTNIKIFDITGRLVLTQTVNEERTVAIPFAQPQGVYLVKGTTNEGIEITHKLIINP